MASASNLRRAELMRGILEILREHEGGLKGTDVLKKLEERVPPTEFEAAEYENRPGVRRYPKMARFATIAPVKAGWLTKGRGHWTLTPEGVEALKSHQAPAELYEEASRLYRQWKEDDNESIVEQHSESEEAAIAMEEAEESAWAEVQDFLANMNPYDFQDVVAGLLEAMGYHVPWVAPPGPDGGIDAIAYTDPLGIEGPRILVQVKRRGSNVSVGEVKSFAANMGDSDVGLFVTLSGFTRDAEEFVKTQEKRRITLVDAGKFFELWTKNYEAVPQEMRSKLPIRPVYFLDLGNG